jgi:hypothetical protein
MVECRTSKPKVTGSNPVAGNFFFLIFLKIYSEDFENEKLYIFFRKKI